MDRIEEALSLMQKVADLLTEAKRPPRSDKVDRLVKLLGRRRGVTLDEASEALGIQPHSVRSLISRRVRHGGYRVAVKDGRYRVL